MSSLNWCMRSGVILGLGSLSCMGPPNSGLREWGPSVISGNAEGPLVDHSVSFNSTEGNATGLPDGQKIRLNTQENGAETI